MKKQLLISFSGGRTSAYMTKILLENYSDVYEMMVVFANTGKEREETLEFVEKCDKYFRFNCIWVEAITNPTHGKGVTARVVDFNTASRNGEPFEQMIKKHGIPSVASPHCTRELKKYTIMSYAKSIGWKKYYTAIGIRVDEIDRVSPTAEKQRYIYPLVSYQHGVRLQDINKFWIQQSFDLELSSYEGNCDLCFKKSFRKLMTIVNETPSVIEWWDMIEQKYKDFIPPTKSHNPLLTTPIYPFRQNTSIRKIVEIAKKPFKPSGNDATKLDMITNQLELFDLDFSNGCTESCEVF